MSDVSGMLWKSSGNGNDKKVKKYYRSVYFNLYIKTFFPSVLLMYSYELSTRQSLFTLAPLHPFTVRQRVDDRLLYLRVSIMDGIG